MANGYEQYSNGNGDAGGSFMMGVLAGTVLGVGLGMLFAPKAGAQLRGELADQAGSMADQAQQGYRKASETASQWAEKGKDVVNDMTDRGKDMAGKARDVVARGTEEVRKFSQEQADRAGAAAPGKM